MIARVRVPCAASRAQLLLVGCYVGVSGAMFLLHGRLPDRIHMGDAHGLYDYREYDAQTMMVIGLCASVSLMASSSASCSISVYT